MPGIFLQPLLAKLLKHKTGLPPFLKEGFWLTAKSVCSSVVEGKLIPTKDSLKTRYTSSFNLFSLIEGCLKGNSCRLRKRWMPRGIGCYRKRYCKVASYGLPIWVTWKILHLAEKREKIVLEYGWFPYSWPYDLNQSPLCLDMTLRAWHAVPSWATVLRQQVLAQLNAE